MAEIRSNRRDLWGQFVAKYQIGDFVVGKVISLTCEMASVDLGGVQGYITSNEVTINGNEESNFPAIGESGHFRILEFDEQNMAVGLSDILCRNK